MSEAGTVPARVKAPGAEPTVECGLCGLVFREDRGQPACVGCPLSRGCRYVRCPRCGYENPLVPGWVGRAARAGVRTRPWVRLVGRIRGHVLRAAALLAGRGAATGEPTTAEHGGAPPAAPASASQGRGPAPDQACLAGLAPGDVSTVEGLAEPGSREGRALAGMGVLPGASVEVLQRYPVWVVRIDHAELALDDALASQVRVRPGGR